MSIGANSSKVIDQIAAMIQGAMIKRGFCVAGPGRAPLNVVDTSEPEAMPTSLATQLVPEAAISVPLQAAE